MCGEIAFSLFIPSPPVYRFFPLFWALSLSSRNPKKSTLHFLPTSIFSIVTTHLSGYERLQKRDVALSAEQAIAKSSVPQQSRRSKCIVDLIGIDPLWDNENTLLRPFCLQKVSKSAEMSLGVNYLQVDVRSFGLNHPFSPERFHSR